jgi:dihydrodipicolinate synthase/N-acetylneuraminate lyase
MEGGAAGVMIAPPPSLRTDDQVVNYYAQAVAAIGPDIPFVIQDYPLLFSVVMPPKVIQHIVNDNPSCVILKHEDWPGLEKISELRKFQSDGTLRPISILTGNGGLFLDFEMERGIQSTFWLVIHVVRASSASCCPRPRRNPYESLRKSSSKIALRTVVTACCTTLSSIEAMPSGR